MPLGYCDPRRDMQDLRTRGLPPLHMAVNLSFRCLQDSQLLSTLSRLIAERGVEAQWLEILNCTETAVMRRSDLVKQTMDALAGWVCGFRWMTSGTGFSSRTSTACRLPC